MSYTPTIWENGKKPAINATHLNKIENELAKLDNIVSMPDITITDQTTMPNSYDGRLKIDSIEGGESQQGENPSPTNPQEIKKSVVSEIKTHGKNIANLECTTTNADYVTLVRTSDLSTIKAGKQYTISVYLTASTKTSAYWNMNSGIFEHSVFDVNAGTNRYSYTFIATADGDSSNSIPLLSKSGTGDGISITAFNTQIEEGTVATEYKPYTESVITLSQPIELYGIGDVQDVITPKEIERKFGVAVLDGSADENWALDVSNHAFYTFAIQNTGKPNTLPMCTHYAQATSSDDFSQDMTCAFNKNKVIWFKDSSVDTVADYKTRLASNPITVVYELAEPTTEALPIADQIALNSLSTYGRITHLEFDSEIEPTFKGEYGTSKVGGYTLEALLTARSK